MQAIYIIKNFHKEFLGGPVVQTPLLPFAGEYGFGS